MNLTDTQHKVLENFEVIPLHCYTNHRAKKYLNVISMFEMLFMFSHLELKWLQNGNHVWKKNQELQRYATLLVTKQNVL